MAADGHIIIDTRINKAGAEKDLEALKDAAESTAEEISQVDQQTAQTEESGGKAAEALNEAGEAAAQFSQELEVVTEQLEVVTEQLDDAAQADGLLDTVVPEEVVERLDEVAEAFEEVTAAAEQASTDSLDAFKELVGAVEDIAAIDRMLAKADNKRSSISDKITLAQAEAERLQAALEAVNADLDRMAQKGQLDKDKVRQSDALVRKLESAELKIASLTDQYDLQTAHIDLLNARKQELISLQEQENAELEETEKALEPIEDEFEEIEEAARKAGRNGIEAFIHRIKGLALRVFIFSQITKSLRGVLSYFRQTTAQTDGFNAALARLKGAAYTAAAPLVQVLGKALTWIMNTIATLLGYVVQLVSIISGKSVSALTGMAKGFNKVGGAATKAGKSLANFDEINTLGGNAGGGASGAGAPDYSQMADLSGKMDGIVAKLKAGAESILGFFRAIWAIIQPVATWIYDNILTPIAGVLLAALGALLDKLDGVSKWLTDNKDSIVTWLEIVAMTATLLGIVAGAVWLVHGGLTALRVAWEVITKILSGFWAKALLIVAVLSAIVVWAGNGEEALGLLKDIFDTFVQFVKSAFEGEWGDVWGTAARIAVDALNLIIIAAGSLVKAVLSALNFIIDKINSLNLTIPDWIPEIGGKSLFGSGIPHIPTDFDWMSYRIPYLAQGAVIPANNPFLAVLGDQKHGTNIEAPLDTLVAAFKAVQADQPVKVNITFDGDLAQFARLIKPAIDREGRRVGGTLIKGVT